jgi:hypothetical protein
MEHAELDALLTPEAMALLDGLDPVETANDVTRVVSRLRAAGHGPDLVSAVVGQSRLRHRARAKFGEFASRMLFTRAGLEQATRMSVSAHHAGRFARTGLGTVADLGCGIGGDSLAFASLGLGVLAVDADDVTAALAAYNLRPFGDAVDVRHGTAETTNVDGADGVWLDPARRTTGHNETRRVSADDYSPSLDWTFALAGRTPAGIKLGPAHDRDALPEGCEAQWISVDGSTVELVVWTGALAREGVGRAATPPTSSRRPPTPWTSRSESSDPSSTNPRDPSSVRGSSATSHALSMRAPRPPGSRTSRATPRRGAPSRRPSGSGRRCRRTRNLSRRR